MASLEVGEQQHLIFGCWMMNDSRRAKWGKVCIVLKRSHDGYRCYFSTSTDEKIDDNKLIDFTCKRGSKLPRSVVPEFFPGFIINDAEWAW